MQAADPAFLGDRGLVVFELEIVSQAVRRMQEIINKAPKSELITKTPGLVSQAKDISARELPAVELLQGIEYKRYGSPCFVKILSASH